MNDSHLFEARRSTTRRHELDKDGNDDGMDDNECDGDNVSNKYSLQNAQFSFSAPSILRAAGLFWNEIKNVFMPS